MLDKIYTSSKLQRWVSCSEAFNSLHTQSFIQGLLKCVRAHIHSVYLGILWFRINILILPDVISSIIFFLSWIFLSFKFCVRHSLQTAFAFTKSKNKTSFSLFIYYLYITLLFNNIVRWLKISKTITFKTIIRLAPLSKPLLPLEFYHLLQVFE